MLTQQTVQVLYQKWLKGASLRTLARSVGVQHGILHTRFRKEYGSNACNLKARSLVRSVIADYEDNEDVIKWATGLTLDETVLHRSKHSVNMLTSFQTLREEYILDQVEDNSEALEDETDTFGFLRLPLAIECFGLLALDLFNILDEVSYAN